MFAFAKHLRFYLLLYLFRNIEHSRFTSYYDIAKSSTEMRILKRNKYKQCSFILRVIELKGNNIDLE